MKKNSPELWKNLLPRKSGDQHKYHHGHALIYGAPELTGATRLAVGSCARVGTGLVTVLASKETADIYRTALPAHILVRDDLGWDDPRVTAKLYGSGGLSQEPEFDLDIPVVLDADALAGLPEIFSPNYILTPHEGEFAKAFPDCTGTREERALEVAQSLNAHIVLKGPETIIAAPDGTCVINTHASPYLATAGTGDVLAGMIAGLAAQNMPIFEACSASVWIHGECALRFGIGLVASDLLEIIPNVLKDIYAD